MAIEAPSNCWTKAEAKIAEAVANSAAFQSLIRIPDLEEATARVFGEQMDEPVNGDAYAKDETDNLQGYAQVYHAMDQPYGVFLANTGTYWPYGTAIVFVERLVTPEERNGDDIPGSIERLFKNRIGELINEIIDWTQNTENEAPRIRSIDITDGPGFNARDRWESKGMWQGVELTVAWGILER